MQRFKNMLYFADGATQDNPTLQRAIHLADSNQARLTVMDVIGDAPSNPELERRLGVSVAQLLHDNRLKELSEMIAPWQNEQRLLYTQVLHGAAFVEVIRAVLRNRFDLVIKAARPPEGVAERLFGSTDLHLLRKCPCPVWINRPGAGPNYRRILAAVDPMPEAKENCSHLVLALATSLAQREQADLSVLHAWRLAGESMLRDGRTHAPAADVDRLVAEEEQRHAARLQSVLSEFALNLSDPEVLLLPGDATTHILHHSDAADLIVMGTVARSGIPGFIIGNTAEEVLQATTASVLAVKPPSFVSPVRAD